MFSICIHSFLLKFTVCLLTAICQDGNLVISKYNIPFIIWQLAAGTGATTGYQK